MSWRALAKKLKNNDEVNMSEFQTIQKNPNTSS